MAKRSPFFGLGLTVLAYCALWMLVPRAAFIVHAGDWIGAALVHARGLEAFLLVAGGGLMFALPTAAFMAAQIGIIYFFARFRMKLAAESDYSRGKHCHGLGAARAGNMARGNRGDHAIGSQPRANRSCSLSMYHGVLKLPITLLLICAASSIGYLVSRAIRDRNLLLPVVMFAACIDFWTVNFGPVNTMLNRAPDVARAVSTPIPQAGDATLRLAPMIGPGDFVFMALVFAVVHKLGMNARRNFKFVLALMTLGMLAVMFVPKLPYLPALIVLAVAVVAGNWREFKLTRQEKILTAIVEPCWPSHCPSYGMC